MSEKRMLNRQTGRAGSLLDQEPSRSVLQEKTKAAERFLAYF